MILDMILNFALAFGGTLGFSIIFNADRKYYFCCGLTGGTGYLIYSFARFIFSAPVSSFCAALVIVIMSRILAVVKKCPITVFMISGIFPIVPGSYVYYTAYYFVTDEMASATQMGVESLKIAFCIVLGIIMVLSIPRRYFFPKLQTSLSKKS